MGKLSKKEKDFYNVLIYACKKYEKTDKKDKKTKIQKLIRGLLLNSKYKYDISSLLNCDEKNNKYILEFFKDEKKQLNKQLKSYKVMLDDLVLVSVDCEKKDCLSPLACEAMHQMCAFPKIDEKDEQKYAKNFKKGIIWEYAILSKDKRYFVLLKDILDNKVQPIERCAVWKNLTIGEMVENPEMCIVLSENEKLKFFIKEFPEAMQGCSRKKDFDNGMRIFTQNEVKHGVKLLELFDGNLKAKQHQMIVKILTDLNNEKQKNIEKSIINTYY